MYRATTLGTKEKFVRVTVRCLNKDIKLLKLRTTKQQK